MSQYPLKGDFIEYAGFQEKQLDAWYTLLDPQCKYLLYGGAASGGKSYFLRWASIGLGLYYFSKYHIPNITIGLFSADYPTLKDRQVIKMKNEIPEFFGTIKESRDEGYSFIAKPEFGSFIVLLRNLDDPSKYKSAEFAAILVEELTENTESTFDDLRFRLRFPGIDEVKFCGVTNPGGIGHGFVKKKWVTPDLTNPDHEQDRFFFVPAKYSDNQFTTENYIRQLESLPEDKRKAYMDGSWSTFAGQYFTEWREDLHVIKPFMPKRGSEASVICGGLDWGRTNPFSFNLAEVKRVDYEEEVFYRARTFFEIYGVGKTPAQWAEIIKEKLKTYNLSLSDIAWIQADPSIYTKMNDGSISIRDQFVAADEGFRNIRPASNDRIGGWENMHQWLSRAKDGLPFWQVTEDCVNLIHEIPDLVHDDLKIEDVSSKAVDHASDACRYMLKALKRIGGRVGSVVYKPPIIKHEPKLWIPTTNGGNDVNAFMPKPDLFATAGLKRSRIGGLR